MSYDFESAWSSAGMERIVTVTQLQLSQPSVQPTPGVLGQLNAKTVSSTSLVSNGPTVSASPGTLGTQSNVKATATPGTTAAGTQSSASSSAGSSQSGAATGRRDFDPYGDFHFRVEINGVGSATFQKCDGLSFQMDEIVYRESTDPYPRKRPGLRRFGSIKLTRGHIDNTELWDWCKELVSGKIDRRDGSLHLRGDDGADEVSYTLTGMIPVKWSGMKVDGKGKGMVVEDLELAVECISKA